MLTFWIVVMDVKTVVWALTETLMVAIRMGAVAGKDLTRSSN